MQKGQSGDLCSVTEHEMALSTCKKDQSEEDRCYALMLSLYSVTSVNTLIARGINAPTTTIDRVTYATSL